MLNLHSEYNNAVAYLQMKKLYADEMENLQGSYNAGNIIIDLDIGSVLDECNSYWSLSGDQGSMHTDRRLGTKTTIACSLFSDNYSVTYCFSVLYTAQRLK